MKINGYDMSLNEIGNKIRDRLLCTNEVKKLHMYLGPTTISKTIKSHKYVALLFQFVKHHKYLHDVNNRY